MLRRPLPDRLLAHLPFFLGDGRVPAGPGELAVGGTARFQRRDASQHFAAEPAPVVVTLRSPRIERVDLDANQSSSPRANADVNQTPNRRESRFDIF
jgi:hypothetical protein